MILGHPKPISVILCAMRSGRVSLSWEVWKSLMRQRASRKLSSWSLAFSLTHTLIFHSRVSLVYGSTCSLSVFSYYKCLLRLNSDIAKAFCQCSNSPSPWARPWAWNSVRILLFSDIQNSLWYYTIPLHQSQVTALHRNLPSPRKKEVSHRRSNQKRNLEL